MPAAFAGVGGGCAPTAKPPIAGPKIHTDPMMAYDRPQPHINIIRLGLFSFELVC